jgi:hypothetical protein
MFDKLIFWKIIFIFIKVARLLPFDLWLQRGLIICSTFSWSKQSWHDFRCLVRFPDKVYSTTAQDNLLHWRPGRILSFWSVFLEKSDPLLPKVVLHSLSWRSQIWRGFIFWVNFPGNVHFTSTKNCFPE